jgi:hypothetical protein
MSCYFDQIVAREEAARATFRSAIQAFEAANRAANRALMIARMPHQECAPGVKERAEERYLVAARRCAAAHAEVWRIGREHGFQVVLDELPRHPDSL